MKLTKTDEFLDGKNNNFLKINKNSPSKEKKIIPMQIVKIEDNSNNIKKKEPLDSKKFSQEKIFPQEMIGNPMDPKRKPKETKQNKNNSH